jgi:hypothetical protein
MDLTNLPLQDIELAKQAYHQPFVTLAKAVIKHREDMARLNLECEQALRAISGKFEAFDVSQRSDLEAHRERLALIREAMDLARTLGDTAILGNAIEALKVEIEERPRFLQNLRDFLREDA